MRAILDALAAGGDPARKDLAGKTPLDIARARRRTKLVGLLAAAPPRRDGAPRRRLRA